MITGPTSGFRTDTDISKNMGIRGKPLQRWEPAETDVDLSLENTTSTTGWDQFEANARLFGATSSYDENIYTTRIDRSDPTYKRKEAQAARIAREIEGAEVDNPHLREERGLTPLDASGQDEEEKYSGVRRDEKDFPPLVSGQPNKYTPPARRTAQPAAVSAAPLKQMPPSATANAPSGPARPNEPAQATQEQQLQTGQSAPNVDVGEQQPPSDKATSKSSSDPKRSLADNATANVEAEVLDHFRQFANSEKQKMQERRRNQASYDRTVKLNELMKFSRSFKLSTPVPKDLVPILAKDPHKQEDIIHKAQHQPEEKVPARATPVTAEQKPSTRDAGPGRYDSGTMPPQPQPDRQHYSRGRQMYPPAGPQPGQGSRLPPQGIQSGRPGTGMLSHRLADNLQQRKGAGMGSVPTPLPIHEGRIPPTSPAGDQPGVSSPNKAQTPTSAASTKFNVRAMEFKPNPAANTFTPGASTISSPRPPSRGRNASRASSPSAFFGANKPRPITERPSINDQFNPIKRMKQESAEQPEKDYSFNGGIPPAYKTLPTWDVAPGNEEKTYHEMFKPPVSMPSFSPQNHSVSNAQAPHQPQMPYQFPQPHAGVPPGAGPPNGPPNFQPQPHHGPGPHFDDHRMQMSASASGVFPSPRLQQNHVGYPSPMAPHAQLAYGQAPPYYMNQGGPPQPAHMRHYPGAPQFANPQGVMGAPMMAQQPSNGPYMGMPQPYTPQMNMYSPNPAHAYPQPGPPPQPHSGYPSPSRGPAMMMHQNSQPGQQSQPHMFMSPNHQGQSVYAGQQPSHSMSV